MELLLSSSL